MWKRIGFVLLLAMASNSAFPEWLTVVITERITAYADAASIVKEGDSVQMWSLLDFKSAQMLSNSKPYLSMKILREYDCKEKQSRLLSLTFHSALFGAGEVVHTSVVTGSWEPNKPGELFEDWWRIACWKV